MNFFRYIGKRSYTIYLVHWPVIVFYLESESELDDSLSVALSRR
jgi:peptidoglycan/LPS O-acetylase OafA/YrhL